MSYIEHNNARYAAQIDTLKRLFGDEPVEDWAARCRKEHGERIKARKDLNGKTDKE